MAPIQLVLHRLSSSNETIRNMPKYEFWVQWSGTGALVVKNSDATSFSERTSFGIDIRAVMKRCETSRNMSFGSNGVDWVHLL
jgi:hypothetical protein